MSRRYIATLSELELLLLDYERVIVFGAGGICDNLIDYMKDHGNSFQIPFIVVTNRNADREKRGYPLYSLEELDDSEFTGALIIIATLEKHQEDISNSLEQRKFENVYALGERCAKQIRIWNMQYQYQMYNLRINSLQMLIAMEKQKEFYSDYKKEYLKR